METEAQKGEVSCPKPQVPLTLASHQGSPPWHLLPTHPLLLQPLTSCSQSDRWCSRGPWALMGPGRRSGGTQRETHSHQGPGEGCWLNQRPSWGPRLARGSVLAPLKRGPAPWVCAGRRGKFWPGPPSLVSRNMMTLSSCWFV